MKPNLKPIGNKVLRVVVNRRTFISTKEVAEKSGVSWNTALTYLRKFYNKGWLSKKSVGNRTYWKARV